MIKKKKNTTTKYCRRGCPIGFCTQYNLEGFVWSHHLVHFITGPIYLRDILPQNAYFWQVGILHVVLSEYLDKSHIISQI